MAVTTVVEERPPPAGTDRKLCLFPTETYRYFSSVVLYTFVVETILSEWRKFCTNLERTLLGLTRSFIKKRLPSFSRETDIFHLFYSHTFWLKPFFLNEGNFAQISLAKELTQRLVAPFTFDGVAFCFKSFIPLPETGMNKLRGRHVIPKHEQMERPAMWY